ncbi:hypothetical protein CTAM01_00891 [Colletotrichum tamarilloi]|uniref:Uncharacterized protein n=1 Tax=Colletotrichum tamarilloi TaxID=1209934 RepID=A0ABQ9RSI3_9PEZI|nr:uncharacterized protein CTAM01_00891 [Colletotrichum tamarilloi]KAK1511961.1 hypothetical protein CTAM01_00891 [Colletotrichum tamarilloi]
MLPPLLQPIDAIQHKQGVNSTRDEKFVALSSLLQSEASHAEAWPGAAGMRGTTGCWVGQHGGVRIGSGTAAAAAAAAAATAGPSSPDGFDAKHLGGRDLGAKRIDEMKRANAIATAGVGADVPMPVSKLSTDRDRWMLLMQREVASPIHFLSNSVCSSPIELAESTACHGPSMRELCILSAVGFIAYSREGGRELTKTTLSMKFAERKPKR